MDPKQSFQEENGYCGIFRLWEFSLIIFNPLSTNQSNQVSENHSEVLSLFAFLSIMIIRYHNTNFFLSYASCPWSPPHPIHCHTLPPSIHPIPPPYHPNSWELLCRWHMWETCIRQPNVIISYVTLIVWDSQKGISNPALQFSVILEFAPSLQTLPTTLGSTLCGLCVGRRQGKQERQPVNHGYHNVHIKDVKDIMVSLSIFWEVHAHQNLLAL